MAEETTEEETQEEEKQKKEYTAPEIRYLGEIKDTMQFTLSVTVGR